MDTLLNFLFVAVPILISFFYFRYAKSSLKEPLLTDRIHAPEGQLQELPTAFYASLNGLFIFVPICIFSITGLLFICWCIREDFHRHFIYFKYDTAITIGIALCISLLLFIRSLMIVATLIYQKYSKLVVVKLSKSYFECTSKLVGPTVKFQWDDLYFIEPIVSYKSAESIVRLSILGDDNSGEDDDIEYEFNIRYVDVSLGDFLQSIEGYTGLSPQDLKVSQS